jgi:hypothetical protein
MPRLTVFCVIQYDYTLQRLTIRLWYEDLRWCHDLDTKDAILYPRAPTPLSDGSTAKLKGHKSIPKRRKAPTGTLLTSTEAAALPPPTPKRRKYQLSPEEITWDVNMRTVVPPPPPPRRKYQVFHL